jgi:hypothetical protein
MWTSKDGHVLILPPSRLAAIAASLRSGGDAAECPECACRDVVADAAPTSRFVGSYQDRRGRHLDVFLGRSGDHEIELLTQVDREGELEEHVHAGGHRHHRFRRHHHGRRGGGRWPWGGGGLWGGGGGWGGGWGDVGDDDGPPEGDDGEVQHYWHWPRRRILYARYPYARRWYGYRHGYGGYPYAVPPSPVVIPPEPEPVGPFAPRHDGFGGQPNARGPGRGAEAPPRGSPDGAAPVGVGGASGAGGAARGGSGRAGRNQQGGQGGAADGLPAGAGAAARSVSEPSAGRT